MQNLNRIDQLFKSVRKAKRCGLIAYVTCGDPDPETTLKVVLALEKAGADAIELGVPFSDPIADGPVIQAAAQRALRRGTTTHDVFNIARAVRDASEIPLIAFSYLNPIVRYGADRFAEAAAEAGFDSVLLTDLPPEDADVFRNAFHFRRLGLISLLAPTSSAKRLKLIDRLSDGFVYYVSTTGVTGMRAELDPDLLSRLEEIRRQLKKPLAVGFGVSRHEHFAALQSRCNAVVVGSAIVRAIAEGDAERAPDRAADVVKKILRG